MRAPMVMPAMAPGERCLIVVIWGRVAAEGAVMEGADGGVEGVVCEDGVLGVDDEGLEESVEVGDEREESVAVESEVVIVAALPSEVRLASASLEL